MILFREIFDRAIHLFEDPDIKHAYVHNKVAFCKIMRPYLINGLGKFTNPLAISSRLQQYDEPQGELELIEGDGGDTYVFTIVPVAHSEFQFLIDGKPDYRATYNSNTNAVTFSRNVEQGQIAGIEWYYAGGFTECLEGAFSSVVISTIKDRVKNILAHCLLIGWAKPNTNFILEIRNMMTDTDFKIYSPANSIMSKIAWYNNLEHELATETSKLTWDIRVMSAGGRKLG